MGQKVNPHGMRVGVIKGWDTQWYAEKKDFSKYLVEDYRIRTFLKKKYYQSAISKILIDRSANKLSVVIYTARPGVIIGKAGAGVEIIKKELADLCKNKAAKIAISIMEVKRPDTEAQLVAENIAAQLEKRIQFRRAMKQAMMRATKAGAKGIKTMVAGRLDGAEIARVEHYHEGSIPLHTLRADIDYGFAEAHTTFGVIGVKVWVYKGEILLKSVVREGGEHNVNAYQSKETPRHARQNERARTFGEYACVRRFRLNSPRTRMDHLQSDRGGACRNDAFYQKRRTSLGGYISSQARHQKARGNPHGQR
jgi:small subunit ribosomal protein S3